MSYLSEKEMECPACKFPNQVEVWSIINAAEDPELRDLLLGGELNMVECQSCKHVFHAEFFLLYHDPASELMAFVYPEAWKSAKAQWEEKTRRDFEEMQLQADDKHKVPYPPLTLFGFDELVAIVSWDEEVSVQGEIVKVLSDQNGLKLLQLSPAAARQKHLPMLLPYVAAPMPIHEAVLKALALLQRLNDRLFVYTEAYNRLQKQPDLQALFAS